MSDGLDPQQPKKKREVNLFTLPPSLANGVKEIGMVTLSADEELQAFKRSKNDTAKMAAELTKTSIVEVNGKPVGLADGSVDAFWSDLDPKVRQLVLTAYSELHSPKDEEAASFLKSRKVRVA